MIKRYTPELDSVIHPSELGLLKNEPNHLVSQDDHFASLVIPSVQFPYNFVSKKRELFIKLNDQLVHQFDADFIIKSNDFEIKRRNSKLCVSSTQNFNKEKWLNDLKLFLNDYESENFYEKKYSKKSVNQKVWDFIFKK